MLQYEWRKVGSPAAFFADVTDAEIEEAARVLEATIFFLNIVSDNCEQIREELREKAQGQTSILEEDESSDDEGDDSEPEEEEVTEKPEPKYLTNFRELAEEWGVAAELWRPRRGEVPRADGEEGAHRVHEPFQEGSRAGRRGGLLPAPLPEQLVEKGGETHGISEEGS